MKNRDPVSKRKLLYRLLRDIWKKRVSISDVKLYVDKYINILY